MGKSKEEEEEEEEKEESRRRAERPSNQACAGKMNGNRIPLSYYEQKLTVKWAS
jgi:hypothetical protein